MINYENPRILTSLQGSLLPDAACPRDVVQHPLAGRVELHSFGLRQLLDALQRAHIGRALLLGALAVQSRPLLPHVQRVGVSVAALERLQHTVDAIDALTR